MKMPTQYSEWMQTKSADERRAEAQDRVSKCKDDFARVAVALSPSTSNLPHIARFRYLLKENDTVATLLKVLRKALIEADETQFNESTAVYIYVVDPENNNKHVLPRVLSTFAELKEAYAHADSFVHVVYAVDNVFGSEVKK